MNRNAKIAAIQMVSNDSYSDNMQVIKPWFQLASEQKVDILVLPEYCLLYGNKIQPDIDQQKQFKKDIAALAKEHNLWVIAGTFPIQASVDTKPYASCLIFNNFGEEQGVYNKIHLFDAEVQLGLERYRETDYYRQGTHTLVVDSPWGKIGVAVCFDLRFSELFLTYRKAACDIIIVPAAFTETTGRSHWEVLLRARAIECQCFVIAANQGGTHFNDTRTWGETMIVNPWGDVIARLQKNAGILISEIDPGLVKSTRMRIPMRAQLGI